MIVQVPPNIDAKLKGINIWFNGNLVLILHDSNMVININTMGVLLVKADKTTTIGRNINKAVYIFDGVRKIVLTICSRIPVFLIEAATINKRAIVPTDGSANPFKASLTDIILNNSKTIIAPKKVKAAFHKSNTNKCKTSTNKYKLTHPFHDKSFQNNQTERPITTDKIVNTDDIMIILGMGSVNFGVTELLSDEMEDGTRVPSAMVFNGI